MIVLYQFVLSPFCDKVRRVLNYKQCDYRVENIPILKAPLQAKRFGSSGKLPVIMHKDRTVADSSEIVRYLEEQFPNPPLIPSDPRQRSACHVLEDWADESLYFYEMRLRFGIPRNARQWLPELARADHQLLRPLAQRLVGTLIGSQLRGQGMGRKPEPLIISELNGHMEALAGWLDSQPYLLGESLTLSDIAVFVQLSGITSTPEGAGVLDRYPRVAAWMQRVDEATRSPR